MLYNINRGMNMKYKYYKCSVETAESYQVIGFKLKDNGKSQTNKINKFFDKNKKWIHYDGVFLRLTECESYPENIDHLYRETIFGFIQER